MSKPLVLGPYLVAIVLVIATAHGARAQGPDNLVVDDVSSFAPCSESCQSPAPIPPGSGQVNSHNIGQFLIDDYLARWGLALSKPAYIFTKHSLFGNGRNAWTSVAYVGETRHRLYVEKDGTVSANTVVLSQEPAGIQRTLTVVVDHGNTDIGDLVDTMLVDAQDKINQDHWDHAAQLGLAEPIVGFDFVNLVVSADEFDDPLQGPKTPASVYDLLTTKGFVLGDYDLIVVMDLDPAHPAGGFAFFGGTWAYIGYFFEADPGFVSLSADVLASVASALYHHEVGHAWGWEHEWDGNNLTYKGPLIVNPRLFGWTDTDGDGVPEILDDTPYGSP
jgi:hypothetical protein